MLPVVIRTTEEMLRLVPRAARVGYALGGRKAGTILPVVLPAAAPGIVSGACSPSPGPPVRPRRCSSRS